jgi:hypothetical protein
LRQVGGFQIEEVAMNSITPATLESLEARVTALEVIAAEAAAAVRTTTAAAARAPATTERATPDPTMSDETKVAHQHAADWLRMVNTTVWTLNSIFLVGSIIAFSNAQAASLPWKHTAGWIVFVLCIVWLVADITYTISAYRARTILNKVEAEFRDPDLRLYSWQTTGRPFWLIVLFTVTSYVPALGIAWLAWFRFIRA